MRNAVKGMKWAMLEVTNVESTEVWSEPNNTGVRDWLTMVTLKCKCGREIKIEEFAVDRRVHLSCGTCAPPPGRMALGIPMGRPKQGKFRKVALCVTVPLDLLDRLQRDSNTLGESMSALVTKRLVDHEACEAAKQTQEITKQEITKRR